MYRRQISLGIPDGTLLDLETGDERCLQAARHSGADLLREMYLLPHYPLEDVPRPR